MELKDCFRENFLDWLASSNKARLLDCEDIDEVNGVVEDCLQEILDVLIRDPLADYFWYGYPEYGGELSYADQPSDGVDVVPGHALRVDKEKIKIFLRDIKIETLLQ